MPTRTSLRRSQVLRAVVFAAGAGWMAGGCETADDPVFKLKFPGLMALEVTPDSATLPIEGITAAAVDYKAMGRFNNGTKRDLSREVAWAVDVRALGIFSSNRFQSSLTRGGKGVVTAIGDAVTGRASLTLVYTASHTRSPADPAAPALFRAAEPDSARSPRLTSPADDSALPSSPPPDFAWTAAAGANSDLFELSFSNDVTDVRIYTTGTRLTPTLEEWSIITATNAGGSVQVGLRALSSANPSKAASASPITVRFAP